MSHGVAYGRGKAARGKAAAYAAKPQATRQSRGLASPRQSRVMARQSHV